MQPKTATFHRSFLRQFFFSALLPILALFIMLSYYYSTQALQFHNNLYNSMLDTSASAMTASFSEIDQLSFTPYLYREVSYTINSMHNGYCRPGTDSPSYLDVSENETAYTMLLTKMLHSSQQRIQSISFYPLGTFIGDCYSVNRGTAGLQYRTVDASDVDGLYEATEEFGTEPVFLCLNDDAGHTYSLLRTIQDTDNHRNLGVLRIDTRTDVLTESLSGIAVSENSALLLVDRENNQIFKSGTVSDALVAAALNGDAEAFTGGYRLMERSLRPTGWKLLYISSVSDIRLSTTNSILIIFAIVVTAFLTAFMLWRVQSASTISDIDSILNGIRHLQKGDFDHVCNVTENGEYKLIADALNKTGRKVQGLIHAEAEARDSQSRAEYLALQSQINPHFLYNTLNGFIALNRMGERKQLEDSIIQLTKLFRHICNNNDTVTVAQEYQFAEQYLELQKLRFGDQISFEIQMEEQTAGMPIPKLVVQPIVENCIVHGMEDNDDPILITLKACISDGGQTLTLEIQDTGVGFDTNQESHAPHVGLQNVMQRLKMFREGSRYTVDSTPGKGTLVRILIPIQTETEI